MKTKIIDSNKRLYLSLTTSQLYLVEQDEVKNLDNQQLPLKAYPIESCHSCYGRGYSGKNASTGELVLCRRCMKACIDFDTLEQKIKEQRAADVQKIVSEPVNS